VGLLTRYEASGTTAVLAGRRLSPIRCQGALMRLAVLTATMLIATPAAYAQQGDALREAAQNPIASLISLPFQNNTNFGVGRTDNTQNVLNVQPVIPITLNPDWNLITRWIMPVIYQPPFFTGDSTDFGLGDFNPAFFFSPKAPIPLGSGASLIWGAGPVFALPTATDPRLGSGQWSAGPSFVAVVLAEPVVAGFLINNLWSFAGDENRPNVNAMTLQPFFNYNLPRGWYLTTSPIITANWEAGNDNRWTVPIGGGVGRVFKIGDQPVNAQVNAYYNVLKPDDTGANWQLRAQFTFLFPTGG
jgi:hypothetical protein